MLTAKLSKPRLLLVRVQPLALGRNVKMIRKTHAAIFKWVKQNFSKLSDTVQIRKRKCLEKVNVEMTWWCSLKCIVVESTYSNMYIQKVCKTFSYGSIPYISKISTIRRCSSKVRTVKNEFSITLTAHFIPFHGTDVSSSLTIVIERIISSVGQSIRLITGRS